MIDDSVEAPHLVVLWGSYLMLAIEPGLMGCRANTLILPPYPHVTMLSLVSNLNFYDSALTFYKVTLLLGGVLT